MKVQYIGMPWYKAENFLQLRSMFEDGDKLSPTYEGWLKAAEAGFEKIKNGGDVVHKVDIDLVEFPRWCKSQGLALNSQARIRYANFKVSQIAQLGGTQH